MKPYLGEDYELPSRTTSIQEGEYDEDIPTNVTPTSPPTTHIGPVTRARACMLWGLFEYLVQVNHDLLPLGVDFPRVLHVLRQKHLQLVQIRHILGLAP